jgi:hypothetical protein
MFSVGDAEPDPAGRRQVGVHRRVRLDVGRLESMKQELNARYAFEVLRRLRVRHEILFVRVNEPSENGRAYVLGGGKPASDSGTGRRAQIEVLLITAKESDQAPREPSIPERKHVEQFGGIPARSGGRVADVTTDRGVAGQVKGVTIRDVTDIAARRKLRLAVTARIAEPAVDLSGQLRPEAPLDRQYGDHLRPSDRAALCMRTPDWSDDREAAVGTPRNRARQPAAVPHFHAKEILAFELHHLRPVDIERVADVIGFEAQLALRQLLDFADEPVAVHHHHLILLPLG